MKTIIITQDDRFYLPRVFALLLPRLRNSNIVVEHIIIFKVGPWGKKKSKYLQFKETLITFGLKFTIFYSIKYLISLLKKDITQISKENNINIIELKDKINSKTSLEIIKSKNPDLMISIAGNEIFKRKLLDIPKFGVINLHSSLLPKYRGLMPSFWVLLNKETTTGVSVFHVDEGIDSGPIIVQKIIKINYPITHSNLITQLKQVGVEAIVEACLIIDKYGMHYQVIENNTTLSTYYSKPRPEDVRNFIKKGQKFF